MKAGEVVVASLIVATGFALGWNAIGAMLAPPPAPKKEEPAIVRPVVRPVQLKAMQETTAAPLKLPEKMPGLAERMRQAEGRTKLQPQPEPVKPEAYPEQAALLRELKKNPSSVELFERTYTSMKRAAEAAPTSKRRLVLQAINAANLAGDAEGLARGLELLLAP